VIGYLEIIVGIILNVTMTVGLTLIRASINQNIESLSSKISPSLISNISLSALPTYVILLSVLIGVIGSLFVFQGIINITGHEQQHVVIGSQY